MVRRRLTSIGLTILLSVALSGCLSRKLVVMELRDTLEAIADEVCPSLLTEKSVKVTLATATGASVGIDALTLGFPISASGEVSDSTTVEVSILPRCASDGERSGRHAQRAVYRFDTGNGELTPLNAPAKARVQRK